MLRKFVFAIFSLLFLMEVHAAPSQIQSVEDDKFSKDVTISGALSYVNPFGGTFRSWFIRSWVNKKSGVARHQIYLEILSQNGFAGFDLATDENAEDLPVNRIGLIGGKKETIGIDFGDEVLRVHAGSGYQIKVRAKNGDAFIAEISADQISLQLAEIYKFRPISTMSPEEAEQRRAVQQRDAKAMDSVQPMLKMLPSFTAFAKSAVWVNSEEPAIVAEHPGVAVLAVACNNEGKLAVAVGTDIRVKKAFSFPQELADVRYYFDKDESHRNWRLFSPSEVGPGAFISGFAESMSSSDVLKVAFEVDGKAEREVVTFKLSDPSTRARITALRKSC